MTSGEFQRLLKEQIRQSGQWLIDHADGLVIDAKGITDYQITINLKNNGEIPTIKVCQENYFWRNNAWASGMKKEGEAE